MLEGLKGRTRKPMKLQETTPRSETHEGKHYSTARPESTGEQLLVAQAKFGRASAFGELYERHRLRLYRTALRVLRNRQDAEDAVQRSFQRAFTHLARFREDCAFSTWVTRIAINEALMMLRRRRGMAEIPETNDDSEMPTTLVLADNTPTPEQVAARNELAAVLAHAISCLRKNLRTVVLLSEMQGLSTGETAQRLGLTVSAVKARLFHARRCLRRHLERKLSPAKNGFLIETRKKELARLLS